MKESSGRRIFYRYKNEIDLDGLPTSDAERINASLDVQLPILYLLTECTNPIVKSFIHFFQRLWVIRSDFTHNPSALHLFKPSFWARRENVSKCCGFLRLFDPTVVDIIKNKNSSKIYIVHKNVDRYDYPVALSKESEGLIKFLALYRAYDALETYGGLVLWDAGNVDLKALNCFWQKKCFFEEVGFVFFTSCDSMYVNTNLPKAKLIHENL